MAPFVPLPLGVQAQVVSVLGGEPVSSRLWFTNDFSPLTEAKLQGVADGVALWWQETMLPLLSSDLVTIGVSVLEWENDPPTIGAVNNFNLPGQVAAESLSANVAVVVPFVWPTGVRLKRNKHYVPGIPETEVDLNTPSATIRDGLYEAYASLIDRARLFAPILTWRWVATSAWLDGSLRPTQVAYEVQAPQLDKQFKLGQRRRRLPP